MPSLPLSLPTPPPRSSLALRRVSLFEGLDEARLVALAAVCQWQSVDAGTSLLAPGDDRGEVFFLVAGRVRVTTAGGNGREVAFRDLSAGDYFGELSALDGEPRSLDIVTQEASVLARLQPQAFRALLRQEPVLAERVTLRLAGLVRQLSQRIVDLSTLGVRGRLYGELLRRAEQAGVSDNRARIEPAPHHVELASLISTNREQITRELSLLQKQGLLTRQGRVLQLHDVVQLRKMMALAHS